MTHTVVMKLLRDKKTLTKFLLLYHTFKEEPTRLADLAGSLDMSEQAVSNYVSEMEEEGLMDTGGKRYRPTSRGVEYVGEILSQLGAFLDHASRDIEFISKCTAIARDVIEEKEEVGLYMEGGFLCASREPTASSGIALTSGVPGSPVLIGRLQGITEMEVGFVTLIVSEEGTDPKSTSSRLKTVLEDTEHHMLAVDGEWTLGLANLLGLEADIRFAPIEASMSAAERGLNVVLLLNSRNVESALSSINARNSGRPEDYRIRYRLITL